MSDNDPKTDQIRAEDARDLLVAIYGIEPCLRELRYLADHVVMQGGALEQYQALIRMVVRRVGKAAHLASALDDISHDEDGAPYGENYGLAEPARDPWPPIRAADRDGKVYESGAIVPAGTELFALVPYSVPRIRR